MGYLYENSTPDRFQQLCQSLLIKEYPNLQCYPVGQPDGGRDALDTESSTVAQIKFKRADDGEDNSDWLINTLTAELPKIENLIDRGLKKYVIVTNARGTSHLDSGRIDRIDAWLKSHLQIDSMCWWRDEIDRRMDLAPTELKLKYSEILTLEDGIDVVLKKVLGSSNKRRDDAIRCFIVKQYEDDEDIKFRQIDLSNELLNLFIDIPIIFPRNAIDNVGQVHYEDIFPHHYLQDGLNPGFALIDPADRRNGIYSPIGAGRFLLSLAAQEKMKLIILEGAPGQGKSTLSQFVCQVHRARYLSRTELLDRIPTKYKETAFRIPLKVDLRDFSKFLEGKSPFEIVETITTRPKSLEGFLGELIFYGSGGVDLDTHEVQEILTKAPVLLFLDGLDEVADLTMRRNIVKLTGQTLSRLKELGADLQVVVTSRPSVFGKVNTFQRFGFVNATLGHIDESRVFEYADKWIKARKLRAIDEREVKSILSEKIALPHIRELTRNPMQLTILLTLIHQVGYSLPDQRTELYNKYLDYFFVREAEKSREFHNNRDVLIGFIEYLAWHLQSQAEASRASGSVSNDELLTLARGYLREGDHDADLAENLFGGGLERIYVLVERIEGLYEFEVQPLREYFCAHYLYTTAPTATRRGGSVNGDRSQRFEAMAANPFWLNVTRFYAGFYVRGELGSLVSSLRELIASPDLATSLHARRVGLALLQDRLFTSKKFLQEDLIRSIFDSLGIVSLTIGSQFDESPRLQPECGQEILRTLYFEFLQKIKNRNLVALCSYQLAYLNSHDLMPQYRSILESLTGQERTTQLIQVFQSGAAEVADPSEIWELLTVDKPSRRVLLDRITVACMDRANTAMSSIQVVDAMIEGILDGMVVESAYRPSSMRFPSLDAFRVMLAIPKYTRDSRTTGYRRLYSLLDYTQESDLGGDIPPGGEKVSAFVDDLLRSSNLVSQELSQNGLSFDGWNIICEAARSHFGERWALRSIAIRAAGMKPRVKISDSTHTSYAEIPICIRARSLRMWRGGADRWLNELEEATTRVDKIFWAGMVVQWSSPKNLFSLTTQINELIDDLDADEYNSLQSTLFAVTAEGAIRSDRKRLSSVDLTALSGRAAALVAIAFGADIRSLIYTDTHAKHREFSDWLEWRTEYEYLRDASGSRDDLDELKLVQRDCELRDTQWSYSPESAYRVDGYRPSLETAKLVMKSPERYSYQIIRTCLSIILGRFQPRSLVSICQSEEWEFE
ncbi:NACHT domain-containing protein [Nocardia sp. NPDC056100]|uniref:NACHT domain-containing protein n=1 Tax=Nocardia sp. NPDC056100 TaxID=3345712 RepID=UPI0035E09D15